MQIKKWKDNFLNNVHSRSVATNKERSKKYRNSLDSILHIFYEIGAYSSKTSNRKKHLFVLQIANYMNEHSISKLDYSNVLEILNSINDPG